MERKSRRHSPGFGYIGFGNSQSVFNQSSKKAFSEIKEKLNSETHLRYQLDFLHKKLTKEEKLLIKNKIRKAEKRKTIKTIAVTLILLMGVLFSINMLIVNMMS
ncbi:hypothetical protein [Litoribaculum gwangyangense]|uniref:Uncharacterized protein n=1 Tax=Litoribaculum gwangyangense TaxID=1130722 RepID=A0ABP9CAY0_9FLAO